VNYVLFESQVTYTHNVTRQSLWAFYLKSKQWLLLLFPILMIGLGVVLFVVEGESLLLWLGIIFAPVMPISIAVRINMAAKASHRQSHEQNQGYPLTNIVRFFHECILIENPMTGNKNMYYYHSIRKIIESKNLVILLTGARVMIIVEKEKFTMGTPAELIMFVKPKINLPYPAGP
jgi:hypothetical protein